MRLVFLGVLFFVPSLMASTELPSEACLKKKEKAMAIEIIAANLANFNTTRTPEGGPYRRMRLNCQKHFCEIEKFSNEIVRYLPGHPDADSDGYVRFPDIDLQEELKEIKIAQKGFEEASQNCEKSEK